MCDVGDELRPVFSGTPKVNPNSPLLTLHAQGKLNRHTRICI